MSNTRAPIPPTIAQVAAALTSEAERIEASADAAARSGASTEHLYWDGSVLRTAAEVVQRRAVADIIAQSGIRRTAA